MLDKTLMYERDGLCQASKPFESDCVRQKHSLVGFTRVRLLPRQREMEEKSCTSVKIWLAQQHHVLSPNWVNLKERFVKIVVSIVVSSMHAPQPLSHASTEDAQPPWLAQPCYRHHRLLIWIHRQFAEQPKTRL
jgi:hypothetical protein